MKRLSCCVNRIAAEDQLFATPARRPRSWTGCSVTPLSQKNIAEQLLERLPRGLADRQLLPQMHLSDDVQKALYGRECQALDPDDVPL